MITRDRESRGTEGGTAGQNPCGRCGACCAAFRVSFCCAEADDATEGGVPARVTVRANGLRRAMRNTGARSRRRIALLGTTSRRVTCKIYERRPSVCRNFKPSWKVGIPSSLCDNTRTAFGRHGHVDAASRMTRKTDESGKLREAANRDALDSTVRAARPS